MRFFIFELFTSISKDTSEFCEMNLKNLTTFTFQCITVLLKSSMYRQSKKTDLFILKVKKVCFSFNNVLSVAASLCWSRSRWTLYQRIFRTGDVHFVKGMETTMFCNFTREIMFFCYTKKDTTGKTNIVNRVWTKISSYCIEKILFQYLPIFFSRGKLVCSFCWHIPSRRKTSLKFL